MPNIQSSNIALVSTPAALQTVTPTTGQTVVVNANVDLFLINPAGALVALTITLPSSAPDGQVVRIASSQAVTTVTLGAGAASIVLGITALVLGGFAHYVYKASTTTWYRCG